MGLHYALQDSHPVLPIFIFDRHILDKLEDRDDARVTFLHQTIAHLQGQLAQKGSTMVVRYGTPMQVLQDLVQEFNVAGVYTNRDYEPYARHRDEQVQEYLKGQQIGFHTFKDHVLFEKGEVLTGGGDPYKVYSPYGRNWLDKYEKEAPQSVPNALQSSQFYATTEPATMPSLEEMGFKPSGISLPGSQIDEGIIGSYDKTRNFPAVKKGTSRLGLHLRFGTLSIRKLAARAYQLNKTYLNELTWREFYAMILWHFPHVVDKAFKPAYDAIPWRDAPEEFEKWCKGKTGYPIVDAGMRELNATGYMHNRVRMITASFLTKHLLIDWRLGEAYFARKLLDFDLSSNNGGWQWAASTGTDAQPYFRIFNPYSQTEKFDQHLEYVRHWVPELDTPHYPKAMVDHKLARNRALETIKEAVKK